MKLINATKIIAVGVVCMLAIPAFTQIVKVAGPAPVASLMQPAQPLQLEGAWVRATVAGQKSTGAFMRITATSATSLVGVSSPVAGVAEVHEMKMNGNVMTMRELPALDLPAGKTVDFKSGGYHIMLMDLNQPLLPGSTVPLTLKFRDAGGIESRLEMKVPVGKVAPAVAAGTAANKDAPPGAHNH